MGRLDHLVEAVYERFKDRYYPDESKLRHCLRLALTLIGSCRSNYRRARRQVGLHHPPSILLWANITVRYFARIVQVFPPRPSLLLQSSIKSEAQASTSSSPLSDEEPSIHRAAEDMKVPVKEANARDDPAKYYYKVQILEEEKQPGAGKVSDRNKGKDKQSKYSRSLMDVQCPDMRYARRPHAASVASANLQFVAATALLFLNPSFDASSVTALTETPPSPPPGLLNPLLL